MELKLDDSIPRRVLVIVAHQDDIEFGCAGSVARWKQGGAEVVYAILTDGSSGSDDPTMGKVELMRLREQEQCAAARVLGVSDVRFFRLPDGELQPTMELRREIVKLIREVKPDRIVCQDPTTVFVRGTYINHPDHRAAGQVVIDAIFPASQAPLIFPDLLAAGYEPHTVYEVYLMLTNEADTAIDISSTLETKIAALACHRSQLGADSLDWIRERNAETGARAGVPYAEVYRVMHINQRRAADASPTEERNG